jgi:hypothetical protein
MQSSGVWMVSEVILGLRQPWTLRPNCHLAQTKTTLFTRNLLRLPPFCNKFLPTKKLKNPTQEICYVYPLFVSNFSQKPQFLEKYSKRTLFQRKVKNSPFYKKFVTFTPFLYQISLKNPSFWKNTQNAPFFSEKSKTALFTRNLLRLPPFCIKYLQ